MRSLKPTIPTRGGRRKTSLGGSSAGGSETRAQRKGLKGLLKGPKPWTAGTSQADKRAARLQHNVKSEQETSPQGQASSHQGQTAQRKWRLFQWEVRHVGTDADGARETDPKQTTATPKDTKQDASLFRRIMSESRPSVPRRMKQPYGPGDPGRRPPPPRWLTPLSRMAAVMLVGAALVGLPAWLIVNGWVGQQMTALQNAFVLWTGDAGDLVVKELLVAGRIEADRDAVASAINVQQGDALLAIDPHAVKRQLEAINWVESALVERRLPNTLFVVLQERQAMAQWQRSGQLSLVDRHGVVIEEKVPARFTTLPVIVGDDAPLSFQALNGVLASQPHLQKRVNAAVRVGGRRWNLRIDDAIDVLLPEENPQAAWDRLAELDFETRLLDRDIEAIDLRVTDRLVLKVPEEVRNEIANGTKSEETEKDLNAQEDPDIQPAEMLDPEAYLRPGRLRQSARGE